MNNIKASILLINIKGHSKRVTFCFLTRVPRGCYAYRDKLPSLLCKKAPTCTEAFVARPGFEPGIF